MMGYTEDDIDNFRGVLMNVYASGVCNEKQKEVLIQLNGFLDGLVVEGRL